GGAGGTVRLTGSVVAGSGAALLAGGLGGLGPVNATGGAPGWLVKSFNAGDLTGVTTDGRFSLSPLEGPRAINPYIQGSVATPYIPDLLGGAEVFGLLDASAAGLLGAPGEQGAALARYKGGTHGLIDFSGFDWLLLGNLSPESLTNPEWGV